MITLPRTAGSWLTAAGLALASTLNLQAAVESGARAEVTYQRPESFTDLRDSDFESPRGRQHTLDQLRQHIARRTASALPTGYTLAVVVSDVDLAGDYEPWLTKLTDVRIVRAVYPPRIRLHYTVTDAKGQVLETAERTLTDAAFLHTLAIDRNDTLRHEKALIDAWIRRDIRRMAPAS